MQSIKVNIYRPQTKFAKVMFSQVLAVHGVLCLGRLHPGGAPSRGSPSRRVSVHGGLCPWGLCPGGL